MTPNEALQAEKTAEAVLLSVFRIALPASRLPYDLPLHLVGPRTLVQSTRIGYTPPAVVSRFHLVSEWLWRNAIQR